MFKILTVNALALILGVSAFASSNDTRPLTASIFIAGKSYAGVTVPFSGPKYDRGERFVHYVAPVSANCEIEFELVSTLEGKNRGLTVFSWLHATNKNLSQADMKKVCGPKATDSLYTAHLNFPDSVTSKINLKSGIFNEVVDGVDLTTTTVTINILEQ